MNKTEIEELKTALGIDTPLLKEPEIKWLDLCKNPHGIEVGDVVWSHRWSEYHGPAIVLDITEKITSGWDIASFEIRKHFEARLYFADGDIHEDSPATNLQPLPRAAWTNK